MNGFLWTSAGRRVQRQLPSVRRMKRFAALFIALAVAVSAATPWSSQGAVPTLDSIRVAIFIELPGKYRLNTPAATFASAGGLAIGFREPSGVVPLLNAAPGAAARFTLDDYGVKVLETADFNAAGAALKRLQAASGAGFITALAKNGTTFYQVREGGYASAAEARTALDKWSKDSALTALAGAANMELLGPLRAETGAYASLDEAKNAALSFGSVGLEAYVGIKAAPAGGDAAQYTVLVGSAADAAGLTAVKAAAAQVPEGAALQDADVMLPYIVIRNDVPSVQSKAVVPMYAMSAGGSAKVWIAPAGEGGITFTERYGRTYRGSFELSGFNKKLAVVNELSFEHYLYSVVGGEMPASWPVDALKAQAVAARSYALNKGFGFQIAHVVDTVLSQSYGGIGFEKPATVAAVDATRGEAMMYKGRVVEGVFSSNAGGMTADPSEIWGSSVPYLGSVPSPDDASEKGLYQWYRLALPDSRTGYVREDLLVPAGTKTAAGSDIMTIKGDGVAVRPIPLIQSDVEPVARLNNGTRVVVLERTVQSNEMTWVRGPFTPQALAASMKGKTTQPVTEPIRTLEIDTRGPSGRATGLLVNGTKAGVKTPDTLRSALGGLPSTRFEIDETGRLAVLSGGGAVREKPGDARPVYALGADGNARELSSPGLYVLNGSGELRAATKEPAFRFTGTGFGHGVGMSQWGARALADKGYDYQAILKYYYKDVTIEKE
ncbi:MAG TPA: SpoIID/LytB domain-containing protein [Paenibacillus sp.]|uniref:SpoIID/LytB domain-containing protein n=1 Tax=Paenibacillus sp. TaxID=58172 RepID=UPI002C8960BB|nr:SpoIID/LytB domain-containing protein [Paenibacillus sp.]HUC91330.1 SpoIID/LytB domain-containing protein [Paenibacillus sp.]